MKWDTRGKEVGKKKRGSRRGQLQLNGEGVRRRSGAGKCDQCAAILRTAAMTAVQTVALSKQSNSSWAQWKLTNAID